MFRAMFSSKSRNQKLIYEALTAASQGNYDKSRRLAEKLVERGEPYGNTILGYMLCHGFGFHPDVQAGLNLYQKAYQAGEPEAGYQIGSLIRSNKIQGNPAEAFNLINEAANKNVTDAYCDLGRCYLEGYGCIKDENLAYWWVSKSADAGNEDGKFYLASFQMMGIGVEENDEIFRTGLNDMMAMGMLGNDEAVQFLQKAFPDRDWYAFFAQNR